MKYSNLNALLQSEPQAKAYYNALPDYVQSQIASRPSHINSLDSLRDYAENLTRGDN